VERSIKRENKKTRSGWNAFSGKLLLRLRIERTVGFSVVGEVAEAVDGVFEEQGGCEDDQVGGRALEWASKCEGEAGGFANVGKNVEVLEVMSGSWCQLIGVWDIEAGGLSVCALEAQRLDLSPTSWCVIQRPALPRD
jgi:hypothetical protein